LADLIIAKLRESISVYISLTLQAYMSIAHYYLSYSVAWPYTLFSRAFFGHISQCISSVIILTLFILQCHSTLFARTTDFNQDSRTDYESLVGPQFGGTRVTSCRVLKVVTCASDVAALGERKSSSSIMRYAFIWIAVIIPRFQHILLLLLAQLMTLLVYVPFPSKISAPFWWLAVKLRRSIRVVQYRHYRGFSDTGISVGLISAKPMTVLMLTTGCLHKASWSTILTQSYRAHVL
jgi:hypothetical protein